MKPKIKLTNLGKKGIFFTLMAIMIVAILFSWINQRQYVTQVDRIPVINDRVARVSDFVSDLNSNYFTRIASVATYASLAAISQYEIEKGVFFTKAELDCMLYTVPVYGQMINATWTVAGYSDIVFDLQPINIATDPVWGDSGPIAIGSNIVLAQSFVPSSTGYASELTLRIDWLNSGSEKPVLVEIRNQDCAKPGALILASATIPIPSPNPTQATLYTAEFGKSILLEQSKTYYIIVSSPLSSSGDVELAVPNSDYASGSLYSSPILNVTYKMDSVLSSPIMKNNYILYKLEQLENVSSDALKINTSIDFISFNISQTNESGPWAVISNLKVNYSIDAKLATWDVLKTVSTLTSIEKLQDPYIYIQTAGMYPNNISYTFENFSTDYFTSGTKWNITYLKKHIQYRTYKYEPRAPNYLMRLSADMGSSDCCGIESMISWYDAAPTDPYINMSYVDYCFWSGICYGSQPGSNVSLYRIIGSTSDLTLTTNDYKFLIEPYHGTRYNITEYMVFFTNQSQGNT